MSRPTMCSMAPRARPMWRPTRPPRPASMAPANSPASRRCWRHAARAIVLRTAWVYARDRQELRPHDAGCGRADQRVAGRGRPDRLPDPAPDLARGDSGDCRAAFRRLAGALRRRFSCGRHGLDDWHGLACATFAAAARHGVAVPTVHRSLPRTGRRQAKRPPKSRLDCGKLATVLDSDAAVAGRADTHR